MRNLDQIRIIETVDKAGMRQALAGFPQQCQRAFQLGRDLTLPPEYRNFKNIVFSAMGGSAIGAEIVSFYLRREINLAITVNRDYTLPGFVGPDCLAVIISYSGNTEETLSAYAAARKVRAKVLVLTTGGKLLDLVKKDGYPYLLIPGGFAPRAALAYLSLPVLAIFARMQLIQAQDEQVAELISVLEELERDCLGPGVKTAINPAKKLARSIFAKFCVIYAAGEHLSGVVDRWRGQFAENSKTLSSSHVLPEMNHNEIVGWQHPPELLKRFVAIILRDQEEHPQVKKRMEITKEILREAGSRVEEVWSKGEGLLARTFSLIYTGDYLSFYLAILNAEDPTPVKRIGYLKQRLREWK